MSMSKKKNIKLLYPIQRVDLINYSTTRRFLSNVDGKILLYSF